MIDGIRIEKNQNTTLCTFEEFTDDFKEIIRSNLINICVGKQKAGSNPTAYSYQYTLRDFFKRYDTKSQKTQLGMIGELLSHLIVIELNENLTSVNPYYNMEERSIKKGFDLILFDIDRDYKMWVTEVKSGKLGKVNNSNTKNSKLLNIAKDDLIERLDNSYDNVWNNAINGAYVAMKNSDRKDAVISILESSLVDSIQENISSENYNVILTSVLFNDTSDAIKINSMSKFCDKTQSSCSFNDVMVVSIHKNTISRVVEFLKSEVGK